MPDASVGALMFSYVTTATRINDTTNIVSYLIGSSGDFSRKGRRPSVTHCNCTG